jgi:hypothetical protein
MSADSAVSLPRLLAANVAARLSGRLVVVAEQSRRPRSMLAAAWLSERCAGLARRMLTARERRR